MNNKLQQLPDNWIRTTIGEAFSITFGQSPPSSTYNENGIGLPFFQGKAEFGEMYPSIKKWCNEPTKIAEKGDVLISIRAPVGPTNICPEKACIGRGLAAIRGLAGIQPLFVLYLLRAYEANIAKESTGTTFDAITGSRLREITIPLPPLAEQGRIVNKMEELFTRLDNGIQQLQKVKNQLIRYKQSILSQTYDGNLIKPNKVWKKVKIRDIGEIVTGNTPSKSVSDYYRDEYNFYKPTDLNAGYNVKHSDDRLSKEGIEKARVAPPKSILVTCIGATIGKTGFIRVEGAFNQQINAIIPNSSLVPEFVYWIINSLQFQREVISNSSATTLPILNKNKFKELEFPLPLYSEQIEIVNKIETYFSTIEKIETEINSILKWSIKVRQSILNEAFLGRLVAPCSSDEPASILLERIRREMSDFQVKSGRSRRRFE